MRPLAAVFAGFHDANLLVGLDEPDDAAVYRINHESAIILTTDFFPPIVDDPYDFGSIAAANAMSDVYAMGGQVAMALNLACLPADMPIDLAQEILRGGAEKVREAGAALAGGHTIDDPEPKYGLAVVGLVHPDKVATKIGAVAGDQLILTKPLGVGVVTTALKSDRAEARSVQESVRSMKLLNRAAAQAMQAGTFHAATDITGFGLLGHAWEMIRDGRVGFHLWFDALPFVHGAKALAELGTFPGGASRNEAAYRPQVHFAANISQAMQMLVYTPETSGGLLVALPEAEVDGFRGRCQAMGHSSWLVGEVLETAGIQVD